MVQHDSEDVVVEHNTIRQIGQGTTLYSIGVDLASGSTGSGLSGAPSNTEIQYNHINTVTGTGYLGAAVSAEGSNTGVDVHFNNLMTAEDVENKEDETVNANNNWFGTDGIVVDNQDSGGSIDTSYETKSTPVEISAGETDQFGAFNSFAVNLAPGTYNVTTQVEPAP